MEVGGSHYCERDLSSQTGVPVPRFDVSWVWKLESRLCQLFSNEQILKIQINNKIQVNDDDIVNDEKLLRIPRFPFLHQLLFLQNNKNYSVQKISVQKLV